MLQLDNTALIITGCIAPDKDVPELALKNAEERYRQYKTSILYFLDNSKLKKIIFCENSGYGVDTTFMGKCEIHGKQFEWLSFKGNKKSVIDHGKGWGEGEIVEYVNLLVFQDQWDANIMNRIKKFF